MTEAIIKGLLAGLAYGMLLGPLFFLGLQVTLNKGIRHGIALALGAFFSDALLAAGGWWSSAQLMALAQKESFQASLGLIGAFLIILFGVSALKPGRGPRDMSLTDAGRHKRRYSLLKGFALNTANPSNWLFWFGLAAAGRADAPAGMTSYTLIFLGAALAVVLTTDIAKVLLAGKIGRQLRPDLPGKIVRAAGVVLIALGIWVLVEVLRK